MTKSENLLVTLSEECAEVQQAVSKVLRFGRDNYNPATPQVTNELEVLTEYYQLVAVMEMLIESGVLKQLYGDEITEIKIAKKYKVRLHQSISEGCGCMKD